MTLILVGVGTWSFLDITSHHFSQKIGELNIDQTELQEKELPTSVTSVFTQTDDNKPINILVIGSDSREGFSTNYGDPSVITGARSDTTMIVHLSGDRKSATILSIPRDTIVGIPDCTPYNPNGINSSQKTNPSAVQTFDRFNQAYNIGGANCVVKTLNLLTGIPINHVVEVDFAGFEQMVDSVGGLTVCLNQPVVDTDAMLNLPVGEYKVNGKDALGLARVRYTLGDGSDLMRIERQQILVKTLIQQIRQSGTLSNPKELYDLTLSALDSLKTDKSLNNVNSLMSLVLKGKNIELDNVTFFTLPTYPNSDGVTVLVNEVEAKKIFDNIIHDGKIYPQPNSQNGNTPPDTLNSVEQNLNNTTPQSDIELDTPPNTSENGSLSAASPPQPVNTGICSLVEPFN